MKTSKKSLISKKLGFLAFFRQDQKETLLYEERIIYKKFLNYPEDIKKQREILIYMTFFQIFSSFIGMFYMIFRRSIIYLFINIIALSLAFIGIKGAVEVSQIYLLVHCLFTTSILGAFFIYQIIDYFLVKDTSYGVQNRMNDSLLMFLFSIPYFYDMSVGLINYNFLRKISEYVKSQVENKEMLLDLEKDLKNNLNLKDLDNHIKTCPQKLCIICVDQERDTIIDPCGHVVCCFNCIQELFKNHFSTFKAKCPICRRNILSYKKLIFS